MWLSQVSNDCEGKLRHMHPHHPPHSPRPIFRQSCTCGRVNGEVTQPENYPPVENITATVCIRCLFSCSRCNMNFCNTAQFPTWGVSNSLVHCCTLSLCHLGSETSKYQYKDHLVGTTKSLPTKKHCI